MMVKTIAERLADLEKTTREVDDIVLGQWDFITGKRRTGLAERLESLEKQTKDITKILKWGIGPLVGISTLSSLSENFKDIAPTIVKVVISLIGLH